MVGFTHPTQLRKAIRVLNKTFNKLGLEQHPDKTLISRTERGFGWCVRLAPA